MILPSMIAPVLTASSAARAKLHKDSMERAQEHAANFLNSSPNDEDAARRYVEAINNMPGVNEAWQESLELYDRRYEERVRKSAEERNREVDELVQRQLGYSDGAGAATGCALMVGALLAVIFAGHLIVRLLL